MNHFNLSMICILPILFSCKPSSENHQHGYNSPSQTDQVEVHIHEGDDHHEHKHGKDHEHKQGEGHNHSHEAGAHVHGEGQINMIQDKDQLLISLTMPAESLWGFEYTPKTEAEKKLINNIITDLANGHSLFALSEDAQCNATKAEIFPPNLEGKGTGHMSLLAEWHWRCESPNKLNQLSTTLFEQYPNLQQVKLYQMLDQTTGAIVLTPQSPSTQW